LTFILAEIDNKSIRKLKAAIGGRNMPVYHCKVGEIDFLRGREGAIIGAVLDLNLDNAVKLRSALNKSISEAKKASEKVDKIKKIRIETRWGNKTKDPTGYKGFRLDVKIH
jgi:hypothetical protein